MDIGQPTEQAGGYEICIYVTPQGISVSKEPIGDETGEAQGQPVNGIGEALKLALEMYQQTSQGTQQGQVEQGFQGKGPAGPAMQPTQPMPPQGARV